MDAHVVAFFAARLVHRDGVLLWKASTLAPPQWNTRYAGRAAGTVRHDGYVQIALFGRFFAAHRIVWALVNGALPYGEIDHINGVRADNRPANLRLVTRSQNRMNSRARGKWPKGVHRTRNGTFAAQIKRDGVTTYLGCYATPEEAHETYAVAADILYGDFACTSR